MAHILRREEVGYKYLLISCRHGPLYAASQIQIKKIYNDIAINDSIALFNPVQQYATVSAIYYIVYTMLWFYFGSFITGPQPRAAPEDFWGGRARRQTIRGERQPVRRSVDDKDFPVRRGQ